MRIGIGGGLGPFRAGISNRGVGIRVGPVSAGSSFKGRSGSKQSGLTELVIVGAVYAAALAAMLGFAMAVAAVLAVVWSMLGLVGLAPPARAWSGRCRRRLWAWVQAEPFMRIAVWVWLALIVALPLLALWGSQVPGTN
jgi:hypothetical protein